MGGVWHPRRAGSASVLDNYGIRASANFPSTSVFRLKHKTASLAIRENFTRGTLLKPFEPWSSTEFAQMVSFSFFLSYSLILTL